MERKVLFGFSLFLLVILLGSFVVISCERRRHASAETELRNSLVSLQKTVEVQKNVYEHSVQRLHDLQGLLDVSNQTNEALLDEIEKAYETIVATGKFALKWKKAYEAVMSATQTTDGTAVPEQCGSIRTRVDFSHDFGYIGVSGHTVTNPPTAHVEVKQNRPLVMTLALTQSKDGTWRTYATSSEDNVAIDIALAGVNPYVFEDRWYEKFAVRESLAVGSGLAASFSMTYAFGKFDVGPTVIVDLDGDRARHFVGASVGWFPFRRSR